MVKRGCPCFSCCTVAVTKIGERTNACLIFMCQYILLKWSNCKAVCQIYNLTLKLPFFSSSSSKTILDARTLQIRSTWCSLTIRSNSWKALAGFVIACFYLLFFSLFSSFSSSVLYALIINNKLQLTFIRYSLLDTDWFSFIRT